MAIMMITRDHIAQQEALYKVTVRTRRPNEINGSVYRWLMDRA